MQLQRKFTHYGIDMVNVAWMATIRSNTSFIMLQHPNPRCFARLWNNKQYDENGTPSFTKSQVFNIAS